MLRASSFVLVLIASVSVVRYCSAQNVRVPVPPATPQAQDLHVGVPHGDAQAPGADDNRATSGNDIQRQQAIAANLGRQLEIRRDADKMQQLIGELNDYLQKADRGVVSVDAIKKAEQIEKLAHGIKSKMKLSF
jgi:hypothetical protein